MYTTLHSADIRGENIIKCYFNNKKNDKPMNEGMVGFGEEGLWVG